MSAAICIENAYNIFESHGQIRKLSQATNEQVLWLCKIFLSAGVCNGVLLQDVSRSKWQLQAFVRLAIVRHAKILVVTHDMEGWTTLSQNTNVQIVNFNDPLPECEFCVFVEPHLREHSKCHEHMRKMEHSACVLLADVKDEDCIMQRTKEVVFFVLPISKHHFCDQDFAALCHQVGFLIQRSDLSAYEDHRERTIFDNQHHLACLMPTEDSPLRSPEISKRQASKQLKLKGRKSSRLQ